MSQPVKMLLFGVLAVIIFFVLRAVLGAVFDGDTAKYLATGCAVGFVVVSWLGISGKHSQRR